MGQLVLQLDYLRQQRIIHRDIKPANLLLNEKWQLVLADFGTAIFAKEPLSSSLTEGMARLKKAHSSQDITKTISMELENDDESMVGT